MTVNSIERALPPIWQGSVYSPDRIEFYTSLVETSGLIKGGRHVIPEFLAAMIGESNLDNLVVGNNARLGSDNPFLGIGWCQLDTGYHCKTMEQLHAFRSDPLASLHYIAATPDLCKHGKNRTYFNKQRWHAWEPEKIDPENGWNPLEACLKVWDELYP